jgi:hypothetical protein
MAWAVQQPLWRVHQERLPTVHFATDRGGRFNPPAPDAGFGTWYLSTHQKGAFVEVFGRFRMILRSQIDARVIAEVWLPSDVRLADLTHPSVLGRFGVTNELSTGGDDVYPISQSWAHALWQAGFGGIHYASRHDVTFQTRSIALFAKPEEHVQYAEVSWTRPLSDVAAQIADEYGFQILSGLSL